MNEVGKGQEQAFTGFTDMEIKVTEPMNFDIKMKLNQMTITCGENSTGKSLANKIIWFISFLASTENVLPQINLKLDNEFITRLTKHTFFDSETLSFEGSVKAREPILNSLIVKVDIKIEKGVCKHFDFQYNGIVSNEIGTPLYLSAETRTFDNLEKYMEIKSLTGFDPNTDLFSDSRIFEMYKLYDILTFEKILSAFENNNEVMGEIINVLSSTGILEDFTDTLKELKVESNKLYMIKQDGEKVRLSTLGRGTQSMLSMLITAGV